MYLAKLERGFIEITGEDKFTYLQGLITNDINKVNDAATYAMMLTPQGKFLYDFFIFKLNESIVFSCHADKVEEITKKLNMYKLRAKVTVTNISDIYDEYAIWPTDVEVPSGFAEIIYQDVRSKEMGMRAVVKKSSYAPPKDLQVGDYELHRIEHGIPEAGKELIPDKSFPMENRAEELNALDFNKGCYVGQELTARTKHIGHVRKHLYKVKISNSDSVSYGSEILAGTYKIGEMKSVYKNVGLALIRDEDYEKHQDKPITCNNSEIELEKII